MNNIKWYKFLIKEEERKLESWQDYNSYYPQFSSMWHSGPYFRNKVIKDIIRVGFIPALKLLKPHELIKIYLSMYRIY